MANNTIKMEEQKEYDNPEWVAIILKMWREAQSQKSGGQNDKKSN